MSDMLRFIRVGHKTSDTQVIQTKLNRIFETLYFTIVGIAVVIVEVVVKRWQFSSKEESPVMPIG